MIEGLLAPCLWQCVICSTVAASGIASGSIAGGIADPALRHAWWVARRRICLVGSELVSRLFIAQN